MESDWEEIEDCEAIKKEFLDYADGLVRHKSTGLVLPPAAVKMMEVYKVKYHTNKLLKSRL